MTHLLVQRMFHLAVFVVTSAASTKAYCQISTWTVAMVPMGVSSRIAMADARDGERDWRYGAFAGVSADTIRLRGVQDQLSVFPPSPSRVFEINPSGRGDRSTRQIVGTLVGTIAGTAVAVFSFHHCKPQNGIPCGLGLAPVLPVATAVGALVGLLTGSIVPAATWERVAP